MKSNNSDIDEKREHFHHYAAPVVDALLLWDANLNLIDLNRSAADLWQIPDKKSIGKSIIDLIPDLAKNGRFDQLLAV